MVYLKDAYHVLRIGRCLNRNEATMTPEDSKRIAEWAGYRSCRGSKRGKNKWKKPLGNNVFEYVNLPDFHNGPAATFGLLDVMVSRYYVELCCDGIGNWCCYVVDAEKDDFVMGKSTNASTKELAILEAVLQVIEKEGRNEQV